MAAAPTIKRSPDQLSSDLARLVAVEWNAVWAGDDGDDPQSWVQRIGWQLRGIDPDLNLAVSIAPDAGLTLFRKHGSARFSEALQVLWQRRAARAGDNAVVMADALAVWPDYLAAAQAVLGAVQPAAEGREPHQAGRDPLRSAIWWRPDTGVVVTLWINLAVGTADGSRPGSASLRVAFTPYDNR